MPGNQSRESPSCFPRKTLLWVGEELARRFGLPYWQFTLTATDANRFSIRIAREITSRPKILVYNYCYHGSVDESFISIIEGKPAARRGNIGPPVNPTETTRVVEFNDLAALEGALAPRDVACILAEPVMTNVGIVHPAPGYWQSGAELARRYGTLLIMDETHTICAGPGGYTREHAISSQISSSSANLSPADYPPEHTVVPPKSPKKSLIEFIWKIAIQEELAALSQETLSL